MRLEYIFPEDGSTIILWNVGTILENYMALHSRKHQSSQSPRCNLKSLSLKLLLRACIGILSSLLFRNVLFFGCLVWSPARIKLMCHLPRIWLRLSAIAARLNVSATYRLMARTPLTSTTCHLVRPRRIKIDWQRFVLKTISSQT